MVKKRSIKPGILPQIALKLEGHVRAHLPEAKAGPVKLLWPDEAGPKRRSTARHHFRINTAAAIFTLDCGSLARRGLHDLRESGRDSGRESGRKSGTVLTIESEEGESLFVEMEDGGDGPGPFRVSSGAILGSFERAVRRAGGGVDREGAEVELRILRVPAMHLSATWVHIKDRPGDDRIAAYTENFGGLKNGRAYSIKRAEAILKESATQMILRWYERHEAARRGVAVSMT